MKVDTHYGKFHVTFGYVIELKNHDAIKIDFNDGTSSVFYCKHLDNDNINSELLEKVIDCSEEVDNPENFTERII